MPTFRLVLRTSPELPDDPPVRPVPAAPPPAPSPLPKNFWWLWSSGAFLPIVLALGARIAHISPEVSTIMIAIGVVSLAANVLLAIVTQGYERGSWATVGRWVAITTGSCAALVTVAIILVALLIVVLTVLIIVMVLGALAAASDS